MKSLALFLSLFLTLGLAAAAQDPPAPQPQPQPQPGQQPGQQPAEEKKQLIEAKVEFVSADAEAKTVTVRQGQNNVTLPVEDSIVGELSTFKAGDKVTVTVRQDGGQQTITAIKKTESEPAKP